MLVSANILIYFHRCVKADIFKNYVPSNPLMKAEMGYPMLPFKGVPNQKILDDGFAIGSSVEPDSHLVEAEIGLAQGQKSPHIR
jgi:hypothetical protein